ncbi:MAG: TnpV protein [Lachnospiraceae bacterium]|nr:TnpV protein [Lachnospiraceae bacterium]
MQLTYHRKGDYLFPNLTVTEEEPVVIGKYGMLRKTYLKEHHSGWYQSMTLTGKLNRHLAQTETAAQERMNVLMEQLLTCYPAPDKRKDQLAWAAHIANLQAMAEENVLAEIVYY